MKRKTKTVLVIKNPWLDMILDRKKTWEIRGTRTSKRGWIHLALSGAGGKILGRARLADCLPINKEEFNLHVARHSVLDVEQMPYQTIYAWVLKDAMRYSGPLSYEHSQGAVVWVKL